MYEASKCVRAHGKFNLPLANGINCYLPIKLSMHKLCNAAFELSQNEMYAEKGVTLKNPQSGSVPVAQNLA